MLNRIFYIIALIFISWVFIRYIERRNIFFPMRSVELTPQHIGLSFEDINFKTSDDVELNGWFIPSADARSAILFCHGNAGNISHRLEVVNILNKIGLNVFIFDYRGYGKSNGRPSEKGTYLDAIAAYNYLIQRPGIERGSIIIYGKSLGAAVGIDLARRVRHRALIIESAFTSTKDMAREVYPFLPISLVVPPRYNSIPKIQDIESPKLIIHSQDDEIVPYHHGRRLFKAAKEPKEFYRMRGGHNDAVVLAPDEFKKAIISFLVKHDIL